MLIHHLAMKAHTVFGRIIPVASNPYITRQRMAGPLHVVLSRIKRMVPIE